MKVLAIETSCDETGVAVLEKKEEKIKILGDSLSSQIEIHKKYGGVFPNLAKREHQKNLVPVLKEALKKAGMKENISPIGRKGLRFKIRDLRERKILEREQELYQQLKNFLPNCEIPDISVIAVTIGPGLEPCLWTGVNFAKALAFSWGKDIIPIDHMEAHILVNFVNGFKDAFPAVSLLVSGGHTQLILVKNIGDYQILGETKDDAAGECFDKTARLLGLPYPGGPAIAAQAKEATSQRLNINLPRPMINSNDYDFSFSGLKTAVLYKTKEIDPDAKRSKKFVQSMAFEIQRAIVEILVKKTIRAARDFRVKSIILGGGVSANKMLRQELKEKIKTSALNAKYFLPDVKMATDNAVMVGAAALLGGKKAVNWKNIKANANLRIS